MSDKQGDRVTAREICQRLALFLNPDVLKAQPGVVTTSKDPALDAKGESRYFVCLSIQGDVVRLTPVGTQDPQATRLEISRAERIGHSGWKSKPCYLIHAEQVWTASKAAIIAANSGELSTANKRNYITLAALARIENAILASEASKKPQAD